MDPLRLRHPAPEPYADGEVSVAEAASKLDCSTGVIYYWIKTGQLTTRRGPGNRLCIAWDAATETACRERIAASGHLNPALAAPGRGKRHGDTVAGQLGLVDTLRGLFNGTP